VEKISIYFCSLMIMCAIFSMTVIAGGLSLKDNACGACHKDYSTIMPKAHPDVGKGAACTSCHAPDPASTEATKFSTEVHKVHKGGKTTLECSSCHAL
jgi:hypothetical protein